MKVTAHYLLFEDLVMEVLMQMLVSVQFLIQICSIQLGFGDKQVVHALYYSTVSAFITFITLFLGGEKKLLLVNVQSVKHIDIKRVEERLFYSPVLCSSFV